MNFQAIILCALVVAVVAKCPSGGVGGKFKMGFKGEAGAGNDAALKGEGEADGEGGMTESNCEEDEIKSDADFKVKGETKGEVGSEAGFNMGAEAGASSSLGFTGGAKVEGEAGGSAGGEAEGGAKSSLGGEANAKAGFKVGFGRK